MSPLRPLNSPSPLLMPLNSPASTAEDTSSLESQPHSVDLAEEESPSQRHHVEPFSPGNLAGFAQESQPQQHYVK
eukprot:15470909-Alexandrium_andersonii.AAC.1